MHRLSRRSFVVACAAAPFAARASLVEASAPRMLRFLHLHTGERLDVEYFSAGRYVADALLAVDRVLRDFRTGDVAAIDPALLDLLHDLGARTGSTKPFEVISGYRSPATNEALRRASDGVARSSLHMSGRAIDIRLADVALPALRDAAIGLHGGGVGYYPRSDFVHVDTGRVRFW